MPLLRRRAELLLLAGLSACAGPRPPPAAAPPPVTVLAPKPAPRAAPAPGAVKIGNPYQVLGKTYVPADDRSYDVRGIASWYGPGFHALNTANGERYDQDALSAAHKTLPMPSYVEVENLDNGRRLVVRVNDRGPFVDGRIIDLSRRSAQL
ncbi:MAG: septal ring lytic transglycosylase RlpA family protein, partial [Sphingomonas sp.]